MPCDQAEILGIWDELDTDLPAVVELSQQVQRLGRELGIRLVERRTVWRLFRRLPRQCRAPLTEIDRRRSSDVNLCVVILRGAGSVEPPFVRCNKISFIIPNDPLCYRLSRG